jgi:hypothetical protein
VSKLGRLIEGEFARRTAHGKQKSPGRGEFFSRIK